MRMPLVQKAEGRIGISGDRWKGRWRLCGVVDDGRLFSCLDEDAAPVGGVTGGIFVRSGMDFKAEVNGFTRELGQINVFVFPEADVFMAIIERCQRLSDFGNLDMVGDTVAFRFA